MAEKLAQDGIKLKVTGIVQPKKGTISPLMSEGVGYTPALTDHLIEISANSEIAKQQLANPDIDVTLLGIVTLVRLEQAENAKFPIDVTSLGITIDTRLWQLLNI